MPDHGGKTGRDTLGAVLARLDRAEQAIHDLQGGRRMSMDRGDTGSLTVDKGAFEGQTLIQYDTDSAKYFSNGSWRDFGAGDPPWITVGDSSSGTLITNGVTHSGDDYKYASGGIINTNDASNTYYTFGDVISYGLTFNQTGIYEATISSQFTASAGTPTQSGVEASLFELGYTWNGAEVELQAMWDALQKGFWQADGPTALTKARWHPTRYRLLLAVTAADIAATPNNSWLTLNWTVHNPPPDCSVKGYPFMYVRRISDLVDLTNWSGGGV